ncbi:MAG: hypothetical protein JSS74_09095 [Actinobacteria bacterium]|nr:hypothetical protein [Actinomycetota bacterium]
MNTETMAGLVIEQDVTENVVAVDWNDDRDVILTIWDEHRDEHARTLTRDQARELGSALIAVADTAESASARPTHTNPAAFDLIRVPSISPDCRDGGKHRACDGTAWDHERDELTTCSCSCHDQERAE